MIDGQLYAPYNVLLVKSTTHNIPGLLSPGSSLRVLMLQLLGCYYTVVGSLTMIILMEIPSNLTKLPVLFFSLPSFSFSSLWLPPRTT